MASEELRNAIRYAQDDMANIPPHVIDQPSGPSAGEIFSDIIKGVFSEAIMPAVEKLLPQGASEIAQVLNTGHAFVPYGPTNSEVPMVEASPMDGGVYGPSAQGQDIAPAGWAVAETSVEAPQIGPVDTGASIQAPEAAPQQSYQELLAEFASRANYQSQDQDLGLDR